jgi:hypothetical protein
VPAQLFMGFSDIARSAVEVIIFLIVGGKPNVGGTLTFHPFFDDQIGGAIQTLGCPWSLLAMILIAPPRKSQRFISNVGK